MTRIPVRYVTDLKRWELPRLAVLEDHVVDQLLDELPQGLDRDALGADLHDRFLQRLRELVQTACNETSEYWLKGLVDGHEGAFPELCVDLPYLEGNENVDALTLVYAVDNEDGTRTELLRETIPTTVDKYLDDDSKADTRRIRALVMAAELRAFAARLEGTSACCS